MYRGEALIILCCQEVYYIIFKLGYIHFNELDGEISLEKYDSNKIKQHILYPCRILKSVRVKNMCFNKYFFSSVLGRKYTDRC
jgi:hypothetical protein